jgi:hypothetical protein
VDFIPTDIAETYAPVRIAAAYKGGNVKVQTFTAPERGGQINSHVIELPSPGLGCSLLGPLRSAVAKMLREDHGWHAKMVKKASGAFGPMTPEMHSDAT